MAKTSAEIFDDKVRLIYEYNKQSPLFVKMAGMEIENNNIERAIEILNNGLTQYPGYAAAHLLLGKALALAGNYSQALKSSKYGSDLIPSPKTYEHYLKEINIVRKQRSLFKTSRHTAFNYDEDTPEVDQPDLFEENKTGESAKNVTIKKQDSLKEKQADSSSSFEERLEQIAREISSARLPELSKNEPVRPPDESFEGEGMIISETLAKIYIAQGEYSEAILVYEKLKKKNPGQADHYNKQIEELKTELDS